MEVSGEFWQNKNLSTALRNMRVSLSWDQEILLKCLAELVLRYGENVPRSTVLAGYPFCDDRHANIWIDKIKLSSNQDLF